MKIVFDLETQALPLPEIEQFKPEFTPDARLKDPEKISADLEGKRDGWIDKLALNAHTARILAIGYVEDDKEPIILHDKPEADMIKEFWEAFRQFGGFQFVGHNCRKFDVPFIIRRSWLLGVVVPFEVWEHGRLTRRFVCTMEMFACGDGQMISLDMLSRILGVGKKPDGISGKDFARLYNNPETRDQALAYLLNDLKLTKGCANKMGIE